jgi:hypothetical protein
MIVCHAIREVECREQGIAALKIWALPVLHDRFSMAAAEIDGLPLCEFRLWL